MDNLQPGRTAFPAKDYALAVQRIRREGHCFICRVADRTHSYSHHIVYEDADTIVFLNRYPTLLGYCLVSLRKYVEDWARDLSERSSSPSRALSTGSREPSRPQCRPSASTRCPSAASKPTRTCTGTWRPCHRESPMNSRNSAP